MEKGEEGAGLVASTLLKSMPSRDEVVAFSGLVPGGWLAAIARDPDDYNA